MNNSEQGRIIIVSGPSGVGKGTILHRIFESGDFPLELSVSATTREPRPMEKNGVHYHFLSEEEFLKRKEDGQFAECFRVFGGAWYGTLKTTIENALKLGKWLVLEIDVKGAQKVLESFPNAETFFIMPPSLEELKKRLSERGTEDEDVLKKRLNRAESELREADFFKYKIINDDLDSAVSEMRSILSSFKSS